MSSSNAGPSKDPGLGKTGSNRAVASSSAIKALAQSMGSAPVSLQSVIHEVRPVTRESFELVLDWLAQYMAESFDLTVDEAR